jgi:hypothetical protein
MVQNQMDNRTLKQDLIDECRLNVAYDSIPSTVIPSIQPVVLLEKKYCDIVRTLNVTGATTGTIYTTPADKDFYLCNANLSVIKDATSTSDNEALNVVIDGVAVALLRIASQTLTAQSEILSVNFNPPVKIDRSQNLTVTNSTDVANISTKATIIGFLLNSTAQELR